MAPQLRVCPVTPSLAGRPSHDQTGGSANKFRSDAGNRHQPLWTSQAAVYQSRQSNGKMTHG